MPKVPPYLWRVAASLGFYFYNGKWRSKDYTGPHPGIQALVRYRPHGTALIPYIGPQAINKMPLGLSAMNQRWNRNHGYPDYKSIPSGSIKISYFRRWRSVPRPYWGLKDMTHWKDTKGSLTSLSNQQQISEVASFYHKDQISSAGLGINDFIDTRGTDSAAEGLKFLVKQLMIEGTLMNMQPSGAWVELYIVIARRDINAVPTSQITEGLQSEAVSSTDHKTRMGIKPWDSEEFNNFWKVKRVWKHYLEAGEQIKLNFQLELNKEFNAPEINRKTDGIMAGITHYLLLRQWGQMATEDDNPSEVGYATSRINYHIMQKINFRVTFEENFDELALETSALDTLTAPVWPNVETHEDDAVTTL